MTSFSFSRHAALPLILSLPAAATAQNVTLQDLLTADRIGMGLAQTGIGLARSVAQVRYVDLDIRPLDNRYVISGLTVSPYDQDRYAGCDITLDRLTFSGASFLQTETANVTLEITGGAVPVACFDPGDRDDFLALGIDTLTIDRGFIRAELIVATGAVELDFDIYSQGYGTLTGTAMFDYLALNAINEEPVMDLSSAQVEFTNDGVWELFSAELPPFLTNEDALIALMSSELLSTASTAPIEIAPAPDGGKPGDGAPEPEAAPSDTPSDTPAQTNPDQDAALAVIEDIAEAVAGFANAPGRIAMSVDLATPVRLTEALVEDFALLVTTLQPTFEHGPRQAPAAAPELAASLSAAMAGDEITQEDARDLGAALLTGDGVPRSPDLALRVLAPLLADGDGEALRIMAGELDLLPAEQVYEFLLSAAAEGDASAIAALDQAERRLGLRGVLEAQGPSQLSLSGSETASELAALAHATLSGASGTTRHYHDAYALALLAEAAGDVASGFLVDSLKERARFSDDPELWHATLAEAEAMALDLWLGAHSAEASAE